MIDFFDEYPSDTKINSFFFIGVTVKSLSLELNDVLLTI